MSNTSYRLRKERLDRLSLKRGQVPMARLGAAPKIMFDSPGSPAYTPTTVRNLAQYGYMQNPVVYRAVRIIAEMCASIPIRVYGNDDKHLIIQDHPLTRLLEKPQPKMAKSEFLDALVSHWIIAGTNYLFGAWPDSATFTTSTPPTGLYNLPPYYVTPQVDVATNELTAYRYDYGRGYVDYDTWRILPIKSFHPLDSLNGFSPLFAASMAVDRMNEGEKWNISLMQHAARPSGAFITDGNMSDPDFDLLKGEIREKYTGSNRAGVPMLLEGGLKYVQMGLSPLQIDWLNGDKDAGRKISMAIGVDPLLLNDKEHSTYNNVEQARIALVDQTALPLLTRMCEDLNMWLMPYYGDDGRLSVDMKYIDMLRQDRQATSVMMVGEYNNGVRGFVSAQSELGIKTPDTIKEFYRMGIGVYVLETDIPAYLQQQADARTAPPLGPQLPNGPAGTQQIGAPRNGTSPQLNAQAKFPKTIVKEETTKVKAWSMLEPKETIPLPDVIMQYLYEQKQMVLDALSTATSPDEIETATKDAHAFLQNTLDAQHYFKYNQNHDSFGRFSDGGGLPSPQQDPYNSHIHGIDVPANSSVHFGPPAAITNASATQPKLPKMGKVSKGTYTTPDWAAVPVVAAQVQGSTLGILSDAQNNSLDDRVNFLVDAQQNMLDTLTGEQLQSIKDYTSVGSINENGNLRNNHIESYAKDDFTETTNNITSAINSSTLPHDTIAFRGFTLSDARTQTMIDHVGKTFTDKGFSSTSLSQNTAMSFSGDRGILATIHVPQGSHGLYIDNISEMQGEYELLLQKSAKYEILAYHPPDPNGVYRHQFDLKYLGGNDKIL